MLLKLKLPVSTQLLLHWLNCPKSESLNSNFHFGFSDLITCRLRFSCFLFLDRAKTHNQVKITSLRNLLAFLSFIIGTIKATGDGA